MDIPTEVEYNIYIDIFRSKYKVADTQTSGINKQTIHDFSISPVEPIHPPSFETDFHLFKDFHHDLARDIGQQVEVMILDAKLASETKVGKEVQKIKQKMEAQRCNVFFFWGGHNMVEIFVAGRFVGWTLFRQSFT